MKKHFGLLIMIFFSFCVIVNAKSKVIINDDNTITYNGEIYSYKVDDTYVELDYKTCKYYTNIDDNGTNTFGVVGKFTDDCTMDDYADVLDKIAKHEGITVEKIHEEKQKEANKKAMPVLMILGILMITIGLIYLLNPKFVWSLTYGLYIKNAKPTETSLLLYKIFGAILLAIGIIVFVTALAI